MRLHIQRTIDKITGYMQAAGARGDHQASNAYDNALGCVSGLLDIYRSDDPFLLGLSYTDYRPGMRIYLHASHENYKESDVIEIEEINGYDLTSDTYQHPKDGDLHFITTDGTKIIWNQTPISCFIELDQTTMFLKDMFSHYQAEADKRLKDEKNDHLLELLIVNEHKRCKLERQWKRL